MNLVAGQNELNIGLVPIPPAIDLASLAWDAAPPFETGSSHYWTLRMQNLVNFPVQYMFILYMNDVWFMGYSPTLTGNEVQTYSQSYAFAGEGAYVFKVRTYLYDSAITNMRDYQGKPVLDEVISTVTVQMPPAPPVIAGQVLIGKVLISGQWVQITSSNTWPAQLLQFEIQVRNTGNVTATFRASVGGGESSSIALSPGVSGFVRGTFWARTGSLSIILYGDGNVVQSDTLYVTTY